MNAVVKPYHEMCLNSSELIVPRHLSACSSPRFVTYRKKNSTSGLMSHRNRFRDGHYYDGRTGTPSLHEISERRRRFADLPKVSLKYDEREALLFAQQTGISNG